MYTALISVLVLFSAITPVQAGKFYLSRELGMNFGESLDMNGSSNDRASVCDGYINPRYDQVEGTAGHRSKSRFNRRLEERVQC